MDHEYWLLLLLLLSLESMGSWAVVGMGMGKTVAGECERERV